MTADRPGTLLLGEIDEEGVGIEAMMLAECGARVAPVK